MRSASCVPTFLHAPIAIAALKRGAHVLSEKPMAIDGPEAARMVRAARKADRVLDVAFNHRQRGDIQKLKALIDEGRLGRPYYAKAWWLRRTGIPTVGSWFTRRELAGGGPLVDIGVHVLDWSLFLLGDPQVVAVSASTYDLLATNGFGAGSSGGYKGKTGAGDGETPHFDVEDLASVFMRLADGGTLLVEASWAAHRRDGDEFGITLYGTDGGAELIVDDYAPKGELQLFTDDDGEAVATPRARQARPCPQGGHRAVRATRSAPATGGGTTARAPLPSPASSTPATCRPPSSARSGWTDRATRSLPRAATPTLGGWSATESGPI